MKIISKNSSQDIEVGDLIKEKKDRFNPLCILGKLNTSCDNIMFPYVLINVDTGNEVNAYISLETVREDCILIAENKNVTLKF